VGQSPWLSGLETSTIHLSGEGEIMQYLSIAFGALGVIAFVVAVFGRFIDTPTVVLLGETFSAHGLTSAANTVLLIGIFLHLLSKR